MHKGLVISVSYSQRKERPLNDVNVVINTNLVMEFLTGVSNFLSSLDHTGRRRVVLSHTLNTQALTKTDEAKKKVFK